MALIPLMRGSALVPEVRTGFTDAVRGYLTGRQAAQNRELTNQRLQDLSEARVERAEDRAIDRQINEALRQAGPSPDLGTVAGIYTRFGRAEEALPFRTAAANIEASRAGTNIARARLGLAQREFDIAQAARETAKTRKSEDEAILAGLYEKYGLDPQTARVLGSEPIKKRIAAAEGPVLTVQEQQKLGEGARSEVRSLPSFKNYSQAVPLLQAAEDAVKRSRTDQSGISDVDLVFAVAKLFDPTSVVREGEFITVQNAQGLPSRLVSAITRLQTGQGITPQTRQEMLKAARSRAKGYRSQYQRDIAPIRDSLSRLKMNPDEYLYSIPEIAEPAPLPATPSAAPTAAAPETLREGDIIQMPDGSQQILRGGRWMPYGQAATPSAVVGVP